jgi:hypothetical protein
MAKLTAKARKAIPSSKFAGAGRSYPVNDKSHARAALSRASEMEHKGKISPAEKAHIDRKADAVLGKKSGVRATTKNQRY